MRRGFARGIAVLPMYDLPEIRAATDAYWELLREGLRARGIDAPDALDRRKPLRLAWSAPELVLGQTCGLPYVSALAARVGLVGTPSYRIEGVGPGQYRSAVVVPADHAACRLDEMRGAKTAVNARDSQSGYAALMAATAPFADKGAFFADVVQTGSHAGSIAAVASGRAEIAAIDAVSWALALRHDPNAEALRVLAWTEPMPGLPYITGLRRQTGAIAEACEAAIAGLGAAERDTLLLEGFVRRQPEDYAVIRDRLETAHAAHRLPVPSG